MSAWRPSSGVRPCRGRPCQGRPCQGRGGRVSAAVPRRWPRAGGRCQDAAVPGRAVPVGRRQSVAPRRGDAALGRAATTWDRAQFCSQRISRAPAAAVASVPAFLGCRGSSGGTSARLPRPSTSDQFCLVLRAWQCPQRRSSRSRTVKWVRDQSSAMVVVESGLGTAGLVCTARVEPLQRRLLQGVGPPPQMGHAHHLLAPGDHRGEERVVGVDHVQHRRHRHRPEAGDLAHLTLDRIAPEQRAQVDPGDDLVRARPPGCVGRRRAHAVRQFRPDRGDPADQSCGAATSRTGWTRPTGGPAGPSGAADPAAQRTRRPSRPAIWVAAGGSDGRAVGLGRRGASAVQAPVSPSPERRAISARASAA